MQQGKAMSRMGRRWGRNTWGLWLRLCRRRLREAAGGLHCTSGGAAEEPRGLRPTAAAQQNGHAYKPRQATTAAAKLQRSRLRHALPYH